MPPKTVYFASRAIVAIGAVFCAEVAFAQGVVLVDLAITGAARAITRSAPLDLKRVEFTVPNQPGVVVITYTEREYFPAAGAFEVIEKNLSNDRLGSGGKCVYTPPAQQTVKGQPYSIRCTYSYPFSRKTWRATLAARYDWPAQRQFLSNMTLRVEFSPGTQATPGQTSVPPAAPPTPPTGVTPPTATPPVAAPPVVTPPIATPPVASPPVSQPPVAAPPVAQPPAPPPGQQGGLPAGRDEFDSTSFVAGDPFNGGEWRNARNGSAFAARTFTAPVCITGVRLETAGTDVDTSGAVIRVTLKGPSGQSQDVINLAGSAINRGFSTGPGGRVVPPQTASFAAFPTQRIEVSMSGHGWFLMKGLAFTQTPCR